MTTSEVTRWSLYRVNIGQLLAMMDQTTRGTAEREDRDRSNGPSQPFRAVQAILSGHQFANVRTQCNVYITAMLTHNMNDENDQRSDVYSIHNLNMERPNNRDCGRESSGSRPRRARGTIEAFLSDVQNDVQIDACY